ncbi:MAG: transporter ATP-binding protein YtrE [Planctomycetota bacterium]|jgi:putative ABC transport system ATP-binding protein
MSLIECRSLCKEYRRGGEAVHVLDHLDLSIDRGSYTALMGPSGSGKTTLLNLLAGIDRASSGELLVDGTDLARLDRNQLALWRSRHVGYVFQLYNLVPVLSAYENVELPLLLHDLSAAERHRRVVESLESVDLASRHGHLPRQLSGGQEQRVAIARALVTQPTLLLADEPTGDLDRANADAVMDLFGRLHRDRGQTIVMVTHDEAIARRAERTVRLEKGRLASVEAAR